MTSDWIPVAAPDLSDREESYVVDALRSSRISSTGSYVDRFESLFAGFAGTRTAISVANGTVALHLAVLGLGAGPGDEVIVPSLTYVATANAVRYVGADPVFVDVDPDTWCIDPESVRPAITPRTKGIIAVHLYGHPADMDALAELAADHGLWLVEDAAEAHGARYRGRPVGGLGTVGTFSFYGNKILTSGEGGALTLDDPALERHLRLLRGQGMDPSRRYWFTTVGYNYRLTNIACALLCAQLERFDEIVSRRRAIFEGYDELLTGIPGIGFQPVAAWAQPAPWMYSITVDPGAFGRTRDDLAGLLADAGVETRPFFPPIHKLPPYEAARVSPTALGTTDMLAERGINLPSFGALIRAQLERVAAVIATSARVS